MTSERRIHCIKCDKYVGTIRDATLMKGIHFLCPTCGEVPKPDTGHSYGDLFDKNAFNNLFADSMFGNIFGKDKP